jgi:glycerol-3-phosphate dehydrogenase
MAEDAVDLAVRVGALHGAASPCVTCGMPLSGAAGWHPRLAEELAARAAALPLPPDSAGAATAKHLAHAYGDRAHAVLQARGGGCVLHAGTCARLGGP